LSRIKKGSRPNTFGNFFFCLQNITKIKKTRKRWNINKMKMKLEIIKHFGHFLCD
jgi:hypothetical protein